MFVWVCGSNIEEEPEPVEVVSEMDEPDEKGGKDRSEGDGEDGTGGLGDESSREFWGKIVFLGEENVVTPLVRLLGLNFGASLTASFSDPPPKEDGCSSLISGFSSFTSASKSFSFWRMSWPEEDVEAAEEAGVAVPSGTNGASFHLATAPGLPCRCATCRPDASNSQELLQMI